MRSFTKTTSLEEGWSRTVRTFSIYASSAEYTGSFTDFSEAVCLLNFFENAPPKYLRRINMVIKPLTATPVVDPNIGYTYADTLVETSTDFLLWLQPETVADSIVPAYDYTNWPRCDFKEWTDWAQPDEQLTSENGEENPQVLLVGNWRGNGWSVYDQSLDLTNGTYQGYYSLVSGVVALGEGVVSTVVTPLVDPPYPTTLSLGMVPLNQLVVQGAVEDRQTIEWTGKIELQQGFRLWLTTTTSPLGTTVTVPALVLPNFLMFCELVITVETSRC